jgi:hypothetical protein
VLSSSICLTFCETITGIDMAVRSSSEIVGASDNAPRRGMVLPFQPHSLAFNHVNYYVDMPAVSHSFVNISCFGK